MRQLEKASTWIAAALIMGLLSSGVPAQANQQRGKGKNEGNNAPRGGTKANAGGPPKGNTGGGGPALVPNNGPALTPNNNAKTNTGNAGKQNTGKAGVIDKFNPNNNNNNNKNKGPQGGKAGAGQNGKGPGGIAGKPPGTVPGKPGNNKLVEKKNWNSWNKDGWNKGNWNNNWNTAHQNHQHGYWANGLWVAPWVILYSQPWNYLRPVQPISVGQKWLGVTYEPYDGGGTYVTGIYEGSPAQHAGIEVGDVIVAINGIDASDLPTTVRAAPDLATLQVLSGRTGELMQSQVNLIH
jgi:hypothetical protein